MEKRNVNMRCRFLSSYFDVQIIISWSLWSGFLRATLFGNSEFFIFVLASFLLIVSFYPYLLYQLLQLFRFLFVEGHCKNYRVTGNDVFTILVLSCCENKLSEIPCSTRNHLETLISMSHLVLLNTPRYQRTLTTTVLYRLLIKKHIIREGKLNADPYNLAMSATSVPTNRTLQRPLKSRQQKKITKYFLTVSVYSDCTLDNVNTKPCCISFFISVFEAIGTTHHKVDRTRSQKPLDTGNFIRQLQLLVPLPLQEWFNLEQRRFYFRCVNYCFLVSQIVKTTRIMMIIQVT